jgi:hypothetical protein
MDGGMDHHCSSDGDDSPNAPFGIPIVMMGSNSGESGNLMKAL